MRQLISISILILFLSVIHSTQAQESNKATELKFRPDWERVQLRGGELILTEMKSLLSSSGSPEIDVSSHPEIIVYENVVYMAPLSASVKGLGIVKVSSAHEVANPAFPKGSRYYKYDVKVGDLNKLLLVTDTEDKIIAAHLVDEAPKKVRMFKHSTEKSLTDIVQTRQKGNGRWAVAQKVQNNNGGITIDLEVIDQKRQPKQFCRTFLPNPTINNMLFLIEKQLPKDSLIGTAKAGMEVKVETKSNTTKNESLQPVDDKLPTGKISEKRDDSNTALKSPANPFKDFLVGTKWYWNGSEVLEFRKDGTVGHDGWERRGLVTGWEISGPSQVRFTILKGRNTLLHAYLDFSEDRQYFTGKDYGGTALRRSQKVEIVTDRSPLQSVDDKLSVGKIDVGNVPDAFKKKVSLFAPYPESYKGAPTDKLSVQYAVIEILKQVGVGYNFKESYKNTEPACKQWARPSIKEIECDKALEMILSPVGLTYTFENNAVVLQKGRR
ncbi:MAG: hypothetical protein PHI84_01395 [Kiritimatiellae bacterium]|nr:hypothetical protein [Kiritimatiellia bacterium]